MLDGGGRNVIREWLDSLPPKAQAKIDATLKNLSVVDRLRMPYARKIKGQRSVFELRITSQKVEYRPLGGYVPGVSDFTLVLGATEKNGRIVPPEAFETAQKRIDAVHAGTMTTCTHECDGGGEGGDDGSDQETSQQT